MPHNKLPKVVRLHLLLILCSIFCNASEIPEWAMMSMEDILNQEVSSISKYAERRLEVPTAITLINSEDIERSGARYFSDLFRYVPGMQVASSNAHDTAISVRGNSSFFANDLVVLMDGRSLYNSIFSGVFWNAQHYPLMDLEHVEVIKGPGSTIWGSNAVHGVVNITSKSAKDTMGSYSKIHYGNDSRGSTFRFGSQANENLFYRIYAMGAEHENTSGFDIGSLGGDLNGNYNDDWKMGQVGFRMDYEVDDFKSLTVQGDLYKVYYDTTFRENRVDDQIPFRTIERVFEETNGFNLLARFSSEDEDQGYSLTGYYDHWSKQYTVTDGIHQTFNLESNHYFTLADRHKIGWGSSAKLNRINLDETGMILVNKEEETNELFTFYLKDDITLMDDLLKVSIGSKFENHYYTGWGYQPTIRARYKLEDAHLFWAAATKSIRNPNFVNRHLTTNIINNDYSDSIPFPVRSSQSNNSDFNEENIQTFELGHRLVPGENDDWTVETSIFYRIVDEAITYEITNQSQTQTTIQPVNMRKNEAYGGELSVLRKFKDNWKVSLGYSYYEIKSKMTNGEVDIFPEGKGGEDPKHQLFLKSAYDFNQKWSMDWGIRYISSLDLTVPATSSLLPEKYSIPAYLELDSVIRWKPYKGMTISLVGKNLLDKQHPEFADLSFASGKSEVGRTILGQLEYRF